MDEDIEQHFRPFRRYCIMLTSQPSKSALRKLKELQQNTEPKILQRLQEYIMLPMQMYLRSPSMPDNYTISVLEFVRDYYNHVKLTSSFLMKDFLQSLLPLLTPNDLQASTDSGSKEKNVRIAVSEDMKIALCNCLNNLIRNSDHAVKIEVIYNADFKLPISHLIFQVLEWCETEDINEVVLSSLSLVNELCYEKYIGDPSNDTCRNYMLVDENVRTSFVQQFTQMLPGITSRLTKVLVPKASPTNHKLQGNKLKAHVVMIWCNYVCAILNDKNLNEQDVMDIDEGICDTSISNESNPNLLRDDRWIGRAQDHLLQHLQLLTKCNFVVSEKFFLKNIMFLLCEATTFYCSKSLKCFNSLQIEILAVLCVDESSAELAKRSEVCLEHIIESRREQSHRIGDLSKCQMAGSDGKTTIENSEILTIVDQTQGRLFEISESLLSSSSELYGEDQLKHLLAQMNGFTVLLKTLESSCLFFHSETYLGRLLDALLTIVAFDKKILVGDNFSVDYTNFQFILQPELYLKLCRPQKLFKYLTSESLKTRVVSIVIVLAKCANIKLVVEYLSRKLSNPDSMHATMEDQYSYGSKEVLYLLNEIINATNIDASDKKVSSKSATQILDPVMELYSNIKRVECSKTSQSISMLVPSNMTNTIGHTGEKINSDWTTSCLVIEGIGLLAQAFNRNCSDNYFQRNHLGEALVFVLSETNLNKSHSAHVLYYTLIDLANANNYEDVPSMLNDNLDYLCRELAILLRKYLSASSKSRQKGTERPEGLPTLLKAVLVIQNLKCEKVANLPELRDTVEVLIHQLDLSWIDPDKSITTEILQVINIFTSAFAENKTSKYSKNRFKIDNDSESGSLTQLVKDMVKSDELERNFLEEKMEYHCPETGFHQDDGDTLDDASYDNDEVKKGTSDKIKFLKQTVEHTRHFISMVGRPQWQILSLGNSL